MANQNAQTPVESPVGPAKASHCPFMEISDSGLKHLSDACSLGDNDCVYDLGSGNGKIIEHLMCRYPCTGVAVEVNHSLARNLAKCLQKFGSRARIIVDDLRSVDLGEATAVVAFFTSNALIHVRDHLEASIRDGCEFLNYAYPVPGWSTSRPASDGVYKYIMGTHKAALEDAASHPDHKQTASNLVGAASGYNSPARRSGALTMQRPAKSMAGSGRASSSKAREEIDKMESRRSLWRETVSPLNRSVSLSSLASMRPVSPPSKDQMSPSILQRPGATLVGPVKNSSVARSLTAAAIDCSQTPMENICRKQTQTMDMTQLPDHSLDGSAKVSLSEVQPTCANLPGALTMQRPAKSMVGAGQASPSKAREEIDKVESRRSRWRETVWPLNRSMSLSSFAGMRPVSQTSDDQISPAILQPPCGTLGGPMNHCSVAPSSTAATTALSQTPMEDICRKQAQSMDMAQLLDHSLDRSAKVSLSEVQPTCANLPGRRTAPCSHRAINAAPSYARRPQLPAWKMQARSSPAFGRSDGMTDSSAGMNLLALAAVGALKSGPSSPFASGGMIEEAPTSCPRESFA